MLHCLRKAHANSTFRVDDWKRPQSTKLITWNFFLLFFPSAHLCTYPSTLQHLPSVFSLCVYAAFPRNIFVFVVHFAGHPQPGRCRPQGAEHLASVRVLRVYRRCIVECGRTVRVHRIMFMFPPLSLYSIVFMYHFFLHI